jgi:hypothetical protein
MRIPGFSRHVLLNCAAAAMLAGCRGSQTPIGALGAIPKASAFATHAERGKSWMKVHASNANLLYLTSGCGGTCVVSYPDGSLAGTIYGVGDAAPCADANGNVYIPQRAQLFEYAHGGTTPIATFNAQGFIAGCSVDVTTGNIAVVYVNNGPTVAVFPSGTDNPTTYTVVQSQYCGYDNAGNLFVDAYTSSGFTALYELPASGSTFQQLTLSESINGFPSQVQWDGQYLSLEKRGAPTVSFYRLSISGSEATVVKKVRIRGLRVGLLSWIHGNTAFIPFANQGTKVVRAGAWKYPKGGKPINVLPRVDKRADFQGVTFSGAK